MHTLRSAQHYLKFSQPLSDVLSKTSILIKLFGYVRLASNAPAPPEEEAHVATNWEETGLQTRLDEQILLAPGAGPLHKCVHSVADTLTALRILPVGHAIYPPILEVSVSFLTRYGLDPRPCDFPSCRSNLLLLEEGTAGRHFRIIGLKASDEFTPAMSFRQRSTP